MIIGTRPIGRQAGDARHLGRESVLRFGSYKSCVLFNVASTLHDTPPQAFPARSKPVGPNFAPRTSRRATTL